MEKLHIQRKGKSELSPKDPTKGWENCDLEFFLQTCEITKDIIEKTGNEIYPPSFFEPENAIASLKNGEIINTPLLYFRAIVGEKMCPVCGSTFNGLGALSRKDNETEICNQCGTNEAMEDMFPEKKVKIKLFGKHFAWIQQSLLNEFNKLTTVKNRTEWLKNKVKEDFGVDLEEQSDVLVLDMFVRQNYYLDKTDWLREKMRLEIRRHSDEI